MLRLIKINHEDPVEFQKELDHYLNSNGVIEYLVLPKRILPYFAKKCFVGVWRCLRATQTWVIDNPKTLAIYSIDQLEELYRIEIGEQDA